MGAGNALNSSFVGAALGGALLGSVVLWSAGELHAAPKLPRDDLQSVIRAATSAQAFAFPQEGKLGPSRVIATAKTKAGKRFTGDALRGLQDAISDASFQRIAGLQKSCVFDPRVGFRFVVGRREAWWLVSVTCRTAILVKPNDDWRRKTAFNLAPEVVRNFVQLADSKNGV